MTRLFSITLPIWAMGVQLNELFAAVGAWSTAGVVCAELIRRRQPPQWKAWWPLLAFLAWALVVPLALGHTPTGTGVARLTDLLLLPVATQAYLMSSLGQKRVASVFAVLVMLASCGAAAAQHFGYWPPLEYFDQYAWTKLSFARVYEQIPNAPGRFMGGGLLFHRLKFANVTSLFAVMLFAHSVHVEGLEKRLAQLVASIAALSVAAFPYARSATVAMVVGLVVVVVFSVKRRSQAIAMAAALVVGTVIFIYAVPSLRARFDVATTAAGSGERPELVRAGLRAAQTYPVGGIGVGQFRPSKFAPPDAPPQVLEHPGKSHNQFITVAAEAGIPAALLFILLLAWVLVRFYGARPDTVGGLGVWAVFMLLCLTHDPLFHPEMSMATMLMFGLMLGVSREKAAAESSAASSQSQR